MSEEKKKPSISIYDAILSRRSIRRFQQKPIDEEILKILINAARLAPSAANLQPLKYFIVTKENLLLKIFETISWAGYIKPKWKPGIKERPTAYIVILVEDIKNKYYQRDVGLATENIVLTAEEYNIGSCIICKIDKERIQKILKIPNSVYVDSVIALGYKAEKVVVEDYNNSVKYWRDENEVLHVPKRKLEDIIYINNF